MLAVSKVLQVSQRCNWARRPQSGRSAWQSASVTFHGKRIVWWAWIVMCHSMGSIWWAGHAFEFHFLVCARVQQATASACVGCSLLSQLSFCSDISKETSNLQDLETQQVVAVFLPSFIATYRELTTMAQVIGWSPGLGWARSVLAQGDSSPDL